MNPKGQDVATAVKDWMKDEIKSSTSRSYDLGRFFFGVSVGTVGMFTAIEKLNPNPQIDLCFKLSLLCFAVSVFVALDMARPRNWQLNGYTDLFREHKRIIDRGIRKTISWFVFWIIGFGVGLYSVI